MGCYRFFVFAFLLIIVCGVQAQQDNTAPPDTNQPEPGGSAEKAYHSLIYTLYSKKVIDYSEALREPNGIIGNISRILWRALAVIMLLIMLYKWAANVGRAADIMQVVILILISDLLLKHYSLFISAFWEFTTDMGTGVIDGAFTMLPTVEDTTGRQRAMNSSNAHLFLHAMIDDTFGRLTTLKQFDEDINWYEIDKILIWFFTNIWAFIMSLVAGAVGLLLYAVIIIISMMGFWMFNMGALFGVLVIPFLIIRPMHGLFDSWLNFMIFTMTYYVIAQIQLVMVAFFFSIMIENIMNMSSAAPMENLNLVEQFGMLAYALLGIFMLLKTENFANAIVGNGVRGANFVNTIAGGYGLRKILG